MGALHDGHVALVRQAKQRAARVVTSIFVNPTQFGPNEDYAKYPRTLEADSAKLAAANADALWIPSVEVMYPQGFSTSIHVTPLNTWLCGAFRPGHFDGVATVVAKLLHQVAPDIALFGEKDYQQLCLIRRMVSDLNMPVLVEGVPTVRQADGLALSSRNQYLSVSERAIAPVLYQVLRSTATAIANAIPVDVACEQGIAALLTAGFRKVDYLELRDAHSLLPMAQYHAPARLLAAAYLGNTRLIDNVDV